MSIHLPKAISVLRLGEHGAKKNKRIWITNKTLQKVFLPGDNVVAHYDKKNRQITVTPSFFGATHKISKRPNGTPILDIKNSEVGDTLGDDVERIDVLFFADKIVIKVSKTEEAKAKRKNKTGFNMFELFVGGGTLNSFFKEQGFKVKGALDFSDDYLSLFTENNDGDDVYTISGRIEDIDTSYYPNNIDMALVGIPCTTFTNSNFKLQEALKAKRDGKPYDEVLIQRAMDGDMLTLFVIEALKKMNCRTIVVEEVVEFTLSSSYTLLLGALKGMGYHITESISQGLHTKRKRWCLVADMNKEISLDNLNTADDGKVIADFLEISPENREWLPKSSFAPSRLKEKIGIRKHYVTERRINTVTQHYSRATEPILACDIEGVPHYSELTHREIANLHGLPKSFKLDGRKKFDREVLGQGVCDMFRDVAKRVMQAQVLQFNNKG